MGNTKIKIISGIGLLVIVIGATFFFLKPKIDVKDTAEGLGPSAKGGLSVTFDYRAFIYDESKPNKLGQVVDSTYERKEARTLILGEHQTIPGLEKALYGMKEGGRREVVVPPELAYGKTGAAGGLIPSKAKLVYQIEMRKVQTF